jgi:hypothetical protein
MCLMNKEQTGGAEGWYFADHMRGEHAVGLGVN